MSDQYVGEIRIFGGNFAPSGWAFCNGQLLSISENTVLFALIGTTYGGDGTTTFAVPDLQGRVAMHVSPTYSLGQKAGTENVQLSVTQLPGHTHMPMASLTAGDQPSPTNMVWAAMEVNPFASSTSDAVPMHPAAISAVGGSQPHENVMPFQAMSFIIALEGIFPSFN